MSRLSKELSVAQGTGLMFTSLLGAGVFVIPALSASIAGHWSLLAWLILITLALPIAFTFAMLGRQYPHAGGPAHIVGQAMGRRFENLAAFLFLSSLPVAVSAGLMLAVGFWQALFELSFWEVLVIKLATMLCILLLGLKGARICGNAQLFIALCLVILIVSLWWGGGVQLSDGLLPVGKELSVTCILSALAVMFWCFTGMEAFIHMGEEFKQPERDFPIALLVGVLLAGLVYWSCAVTVIKFNAFGSQLENASAIPTLAADFFGPTGRWLAAGVGYLACFAGINLYMQSFARLLWSLADERAIKGSGFGKLAVLSEKKIPVTALWVVVVLGMFSSTVTHCAGLPMERLMCCTNGNYVVLYLLSMLAGIKLLTGVKRGIAAISVGLCLMVIAALRGEGFYVLVMMLAFFGLDWVTSRAKVVAVR